jgi:hypothetical protein
MPSGTSMSRRLRGGRRWIRSAIKAMTSSRVGWRGAFEGSKMARPHMWPYVVGVSMLKKAVSRPASCFTTPPACLPRSTIAQGSLTRRVVNRSLMMNCVVATERRPEPANERTFGIAADLCGSKDAQLMLAHERTRLSPHVVTGDREPRRPGWVSRSGL